MARISLRARSAFHLSTLEATYIKTLKPIMSPERIRLFFTNFSLVTVSQHNPITLSPSFDTTSNFINTTLMPFYRFLYVSLTVSHTRSNNQLPRWPYKPWHSFSHFILATILEKFLTTWRGSSPWSRRRWAQGEARPLHFGSLTLAIIPNVNNSVV